MLFVVVIVGLSLVVYRQWQEVEPLRQEVRRLRGLLGYLIIDDPGKAQFIKADTPDETAHWRWRLYLPPGGKYSLNVYTGVLPAGVNPPQAGKFAAAVLEGEGKLTSRPLPGGEFQLDVALVAEGARWNLITKPGGAHVLPAENSRLAAASKWTNIFRRSPRILEPGEPASLMRLSKSRWEQRDEGRVFLLNPDKADGIIVWLEQHPLKAKP